MAQKASHTKSQCSTPKWDVTNFNPSCYQYKEKVTVQKFSPFSLLC